MGQRPKTIKPLEENIGQKIHNNVFVNDTKGISNKRQNKQIVLHKNEKLSCIKDNLHRVKMQFIE